MKIFTGIITLTIFLFPFLSFPQTFTPMGIDDPVIHIESVVTPNTACDPEQTNGSITVTASIEGNALSEDSQFKWFVGNHSAPSDAFEDGVDGDIVEIDNSTSTIQNLAPGPYTVIVSDGEVISEPKKYVIKDEKAIPSIVEITVTPQNCNIPGSIEVTAMSPDNPGDYTYTWYRGSVEAGNEITGKTGPVLNYQDAGIYYVVANGKEPGCSSPPKEAEIKDVSTGAKISFVQTPNTSCEAGNGMLEATLSPEGNYSFTWYVGRGTTTPFDGPVSENGHITKIENVKAGDYTLSAINNASGCEVIDTFTVENHSGAPEILTVSVSDQDSCDPSGSIAVTGLSEGSPSGYTYAWYKESVVPENLIAGVNGPLLDATNYAGIGAGTYYIVATAEGSGCASAPRIAIIKDLSEDPVIILTEDSGQKSITAEVKGEGTFSFEWFVGPDHTPFVEGTHGNITTDQNTSTIENIKPGEYTVTVASQATGCTATKTYNLQGESVKPQVVDIGSGADDPTNQSPVTVWVEFSEPMSGSFDLGKIILQNGAAKNLGRVSSNTFSFEVLPVADGEISIAIPAGIASDQEGNPNEASTETFRIVYDGTAPTVVINSDISGVTEISPVPVAIQFSEAVTGFDREDIDLTNADLSGFTTEDNKNYTLSLAPLIAGNVTVSIDEGVAADAAGNTNTRGNFQFAYKYADTTRVAFAEPASQTISRSDGTFSLEVTLSDPDPSHPTTVAVALTEGDPAAIGHYTTQTLTFEAGSNESQFISLNISGDYHTGQEKVLVFSLQNVSGGHEAIIGTTRTFELTIEYDGVTGLDPEVISGVDIFPNPVATYLQINFDRANISKAPKVMIYDLYGQQVKARQLQSGNNRINVSELKDGIYMVYFFTKDRAMVQKIQVLK